MCLFGIFYYFLLVEGEKFDNGRKGEEKRSVLIEYGLSARTPGRIGYLGCEIWMWGLGWWLLIPLWLFRQALPRRVEIQQRMAVTSRHAWENDLCAAMICRVCMSCPPSI